MSDNRVSDSLLEIAVEFAGLACEREADVQEAFRVWLEYEKKRFSDAKAVLPRVDDSLEKPPPPGSCDGMSSQQKKRSAKARKQWDEKAAECMTAAGRAAARAGDAFRKAMKVPAPLDISRAERVAWLALLVNTIIENGANKARAERLGLRRFEIPTDDDFDDLHLALLFDVSELASCQQEAAAALGMVKKDWGVGGESAAKTNGHGVGTGAEDQAHTKRSSRKSRGRPRLSEGEWQRRLDLAEAWRRYDASSSYLAGGRHTKEVFLEDYNRQHGTNYSDKELESGLRKMRRLRV